MAGDGVLRLVAEGVPAQRAVALVQPDVDVPLGADALGEPDVVGVRVSEDDRLDVVGGAPDRLQVPGQTGPAGGQAAVDDGHLPLVLDEVPVGVGVLDAVDAVGDVALEHE